MKNTLPTCKETSHKMYSTQSKADLALAGIKAYGHGDTSDLKTWECQSCGQYHVGHFSKYIAYLERLERQGKLDLAY